LSGATVWKLRVVLLGLARRRERGDKGEEAQRGEEALEEACERSGSWGLSEREVIKITSRMTEDHIKMQP
jgi:hypothetical protein